MLVCPRCGLSVLGMTVMDSLFDLWIRATEASVSIHAFVDDWQVLAKTTEQLESSWAQVEKFATAVDFAFDQDKTFVWSARSEERLQLRQGALGLKLTSKVSGAHHNFCRRRGNRTVQARIASMEAMWRRLRASTSPYKFKSIALVMMVWPRALHGISVAHLGRKHYGHLRSAAMKGLGQTLRDFRVLAEDDMLQQDLQLQWVEPRSTNGPIGVLLGRVALLGWTSCEDGMFQDSIGRFDLLRFHWDAVVLRVKVAWPHVLGDEVLHRTSMDGIHHSDLGMTQSLLRAREESDQALLRCHLDGALYTQNGKAKFQQDVGDRCSWCTMKDGFFHRAWECEFFQPEVLEEVPRLPRGFSCHAWVSEASEVT
eukprot:Skav202844  [mRNA]  locus=scaffold746:207412:208592:- [translate_table: standard]